MRLPLTKSWVLALMVVLLVSSMAFGKTLSTDVIVVGGGGAGLAAAIEAADEGADVILVEKMAFMGGSTLICGGVVLAAGTDLQRELGIEDSADAMYEYWMLWNQWQVDPSLARIIADQSADVIDWLIDLGVDFPAVLTPPGVNPATGGLYISGADSVPRGHTANRGGLGLTQPMIDRVNNHPNIQVMLSSPAVELIAEEGRVVGVVVQTPEEEIQIRGKAVVLASGGFGHNEEMMRRYLPAAIAHGSRYVSISGKGSTGDGMRMAAQLGAELVDMEGTLLFAMPEVAAPSPVYLVYVNQQGRRFVNEIGFYELINHGVSAQKDGLAWGIFDEAAVSASGMSQEQLEDNLRKGKIFKGDTLEELAVKVGINPRGLVNTINQWNDYAAAGSDPDFFKPVLNPVSSPPYYAVQVTRHYHVVSSGGLRIDQEARVLKETGEPIPGLFAAGETTGGIYSKTYPGSGSAVADALVFGRIAGRNAAELAK
ncbi:MAG: flavocytochrome c [Limnochordia bacterium]